MNENYDISISWYNSQFFNLLRPSKKKNSCLLLHAKELTYVTRVVMPRISVKCFENLITRRTRSGFSYIIIIQLINTISSLILSSKYSYPIIIKSKLKDTGYTYIYGRNKHAHLKAELFAK